jgi:hypothetical protein
MKTLGFALGEFVGLFVDDGALAFEIVAVVAVTGMLATLFPGATSLAGSFLLLGCLGTLAINVANAARRRPGSGD